MSYGLQVVNAGGYVQIDDTYANYSLIQEGTTTTGQVVTVPGILPEDIVFVRIPVGPTIGAFTWYAAPVDGFSMKSQSGYDFTFSYRVFRHASVLTPTANSPFQVFNGSGKLVFDAALVQPRIRTYAQFDPTGSPVTLSSLGVSPWIYANVLALSRYVLSGSSSQEKTIAASVFSDYSVLISETVNKTLPMSIYTTYVPSTKSILLSI